MLAWTIYLSFAGALVEALLPKGKATLARWLALTVAVAGLALAAAGFACRRWGFTSCSRQTASAWCWCC
jgi:NADH:ubiquinone oxidoreductase subunit 4 (subunit M)